MNKMFTLETQDGQVSVRVSEITQVSAISRVAEHRLVCFGIHMRNRETPLYAIQRLPKTWEPDGVGKKEMKPEELDARRNLNGLREELLTAIEYQT